MKKKFVLGLLTITTIIGLTGCNVVSFAVKARGEEVSALDWAESYISCYEDNLKDFKDNIFSGFSVSEDIGTVSSSFNIKYRKQTTIKNTSISNEDKNKLKTSTNSKENTTVTYDIENNTYKQKIEKSSTKNAPQGNNYSNSEASIQYQKYQNNVYLFDLVNKTYTESPFTPTVQLAALSDSYLINLYLTIANVYNTLKLQGESFGTSSDYKDSKFYVKGNVLTVVTTTDYKDTVDDNNIKVEDGTVVNTRQYILEKSYITVTKYTEYKNCSWLNNNNEYKYKLEQSVGDTYTLKLNGAVSKVYTEDFTFKN